MAATTIEIGEAKRKSARCLFGRPEPGQIGRQLTEQTARMIREDSRRWNFDFNGGVPIVGADGDYQFEEVSAADVPSFYHDRSARSTRKAIRRRDVSPVSDTVAMPAELQEQLLLVDEPEPTLLVASTSSQIGIYEKPVTRSSTRKTDEQQQDAYTLKQTKLTNYMPIRKRRSEINLLATIDSEIPSQKDKRASGVGKNKGAPKRPLRFVASNIPKSSVSDTALVSSPRSPPAKKVPVGTRRALPRRNAGAGDF